MTQRRGKPVTDRHDHYQEITDRIVAALESGTKPWRQPWSNAAAGGPAMPVNAATGRLYRGVNVLLLAMSSVAFRGGDPRFCTYKQAADRGWQVRRGERGTTVFFYKQWQVVDTTAAPDAEERIRRIPMLRAHTVFNASQLEGIAPYVPPDLAQAPWRRPEAAELILRDSRATVRIGGTRAFYSPTLDFIGLPPEHSFSSSQTWAATVLHELAHWTSGPSRLDRDIKNRLGSELYSREELRAELRSVFVGAALGLPCDIPHHADYIGEWIKQLRQDTREIFRAAAEAQRIADYLLAFHPDYVRATADGCDPSLDDAARASVEQSDAA